MKVAIVSLGRAHLLQLAKYLNEQTDADVVFYTMMPKARCRQFGYNGPVRSLLFPVGVCEIIIRHLKCHEYTKDKFRIKLVRLFDIIVSLILKRCDILIGLNGNATRCSVAAKKRYKAITICDQGSSHILTQNMAHFAYSNSPVSEINTNNMLKHYAVSDYLMTACDYVKKTDIENGITKDRIFVNPYGVNLDIFKPINHGETDDKIYDVIMVGSWWKHKGCDKLLKVCIERLRLRLLHVGTLIDCPVSDSPLFTHIDAVPEAELPKFYSRSKIFAMCSLDEGFGLVLLQAAACGLPVVGSSRTGLPSMRKLLNDTPYCIEISEPLNEDNIELALRKALNLYDKNPTAVISDYAGNLQNISWEAYGSRYYQTLNDLLK